MVGPPKEVWSSPQERYPAKVMGLMRRLVMGGGGVSLRKVGVVLALAHLTLTREPAPNGEYLAGGGAQVQHR